MNDLMEIFNFNKQSKDRHPLGIRLEPQIKQEIATKIAELEIRLNKKVTFSDLIQFCVVAQFQNPDFFEKIEEKIKKDKENK